MLHLLAALITSGMFGAAYIVGSRLWRRILRLRLRRPLERPLPTEWAPIIERNLPIAQNLTGQEKDRLLAVVQDLVDTRHWEGCGGLELTEEIQVCIAAQAAILLLGFTDPPYPQVDSILVYPSTFQPRHFSWTPSREKPRRVAVLGEAWRHGVVILSWDAIRSGATNPFDGNNVVFHEFAHQLDAENGPLDGVPVLAQRSAYPTWSALIEREYEELVYAKERRKRSVLSYYGATTPAEFFAVATEAFFEKASALKRKEPELYRELASFYRQDPAGWASRRGEAQVQGAG